MFDEILLTSVSVLMLLQYVEILALGDKPRHDVDWILSLLDQNDPVERLMIAASKISHLFLSIQTTSSPPDQTTIETWISAGRASDFELSQWPLHLPDRWLPLVVYSAQGEPLITYKCIANAVIWNYYRAVRVMVQQLLFNLNKTLVAIVQANQTREHPIHTESALDGSDPRDVIQEMTTDVCRSIPFALGDVDSLGRPTKPVDGKQSIRAAQAYGLLWPLWYILSGGMPTESQFNQIQTVLWRIGSTLGIKLALILAREAERMRSEANSQSGPAIASSGRQR